MHAKLTTRAPAKINLNLIVHGRRPDGYHDLSSLVMFAGVGDELSLEGGAPVGLTLGGPLAAGLQADDSNLVLRAAANLGRRVPGLRSGHFTLVKRLPIASGIGGGSADAAAALRLLARLNGLGSDHPALMAAARETGADVPVCLGSRAAMMRGIGEDLQRIAGMPKLCAMLVNPGISLSTAEVFKSLGLEAGERMRPMPTMAGEGSGVSSWHEDSADDAQELIASLASGHGNDLERPASGIAPQISAVLRALAASDGCRLARMSGSGATCFGLFDTPRQSLLAARRLAAMHPSWWVKPTVLR